VPRLRFIKKLDSVAGTAIFERAGFLKIFAFEVHRSACQGIDRRTGHHRGPVNQSPDALGCCVNVA
jgi:hypothetical protein